MTEGSLSWIFERHRPELTPCHGQTPGRPALHYDVSQLQCLRALSLAFFPEIAQVTSGEM